MSESRVKKIRKEVYGDYSIRARTYKRHPKTGVITADSRRQQYQILKKRKAS